MKDRINSDSVKKGFFSRFSWYTGLIVGVLSSSLIVWGATFVITHTFIPNTTISAQQVNDNFVDVQNKINEMNYKVTFGLATDFNVAASLDDTAFVFDQIINDHTGGQYDPGTGVFTVPVGEAGFYHVAAVINTTQIGSAKASISFSIDNGLSWNNFLNWQSLTGTESHEYLKTVYLNDNDTVKFRVQEHNASTFNINATGTKILIMRLSKI